MRNVTIWENTDSLKNSPFVRVFVYKGNNRTLNEFLSPNFILRDKNICARYPNSPADKQGLPFTPGIESKGQVVIMGYDSTDAMFTGNGYPLVLLRNWDTALLWLIVNNFYFYGDESVTRRVRKLVPVDVDARQHEYVMQARFYQKRQNNLDDDWDNLDDDCGQEPPRAKNVVDNTDLNEALTKLAPPDKIGVDSVRAENFGVQIDKSVSAPKRVELEPRVGLFQRIRKFLGL
ncbi:hypothetical protein DEEACLCL_00055 [Salmonella phage CRW-SP2]|nr:hypothetical protein DEEACLCL_00055 [Salmonella phage CRW-SP2]